MRSISYVAIIAIIAVWGAVNLFESSSSFDDLENNQAQATRALFICGEDGFKSTDCKTAIGALPTKFWPRGRLYPVSCGQATFAEKCEVSIGNKPNQARQHSRIAPMRCWDTRWVNGLRVEIEKPSCYKAVLEKKRKALEAR